MARGGCGGLALITGSDTQWAGYKYPECHVYAGALDHADLDAVVDRFGSVPWRQPNSVQMFLMDQEQSFFRVWMIRGAGCGSTRPHRRMRKTTSSGPRTAARRTGCVIGCDPGGFRASVAGMIEHSRRGLVEWWAMTIDCPEPHVMGEFYAALLGGKVTRRIADDVSVEGAGLLLNFRRVPDYQPPTWPSSDVPLHSHFEFVVEDPDAAARQLLQQGARLAERQDPDDPHIVVLLDPAGYRRTVVALTPVTRFSVAATSG